ncbi:uncharacterized protein LOC111646487 [Seriola lalandi dorsalis]|uniref:uncharacterized protein LOC111646487 n=1 Tax=Seriola lalandi dorsalis TaxID=1841481 RepID=UPI000C6F5705|nr:uncharacterized protein LOC111646487 [Seriola lalandi dorsalis]
MEEDALRSYCRTMISRVQIKQQHPYPSAEEEKERNNKHKGGRGRERYETGRQVIAGGELRDYRESNLPLPDCTKRDRHQSSPGLMCQGPEVQPVPIQLISMLRLKTIKEQMRRAAEVELHDPAVCSVCEQEQAFLALKSFIWRKKTQLQFQTLTARLSTHMSHEDYRSGASLCKVSLSPPMPLTGFGRNYLVKICGSQQPGVALATTKERGVALATDEMRGHPDKNATGTHLARPRCPFPDR